MNPAIITVLSNLGFGGVVVMLILLKILVPKWFVDKLERENDALAKALETERIRNAELSGTTGTTARLIEAIADMAAEHRPAQLPPGGPP